MAQYIIYTDITKHQVNNLCDLTSISVKSHTQHGKNCTYRSQNVGNNKFRTESDRLWVDFKKIPQQSLEKVEEIHEKPHPG